MKTENLISISNFQISNVNGYLTFFTPCRNSYCAAIEPTALLIKRLVHVAEADLDQRLGQVHIPIHSNIDPSASQAFCQAAAEANVQISNSVLNSATTATFRSLICTDCSAKSTRLVLTLDVRAECYVCVLIALDNKRFLHYGPVGYSHGCGSLDEHLYGVLSADFAARHPSLSYTASPKATSRLTKGLEDARWRLSTQRHKPVIIESFQEGIDFVAQLHYEQVEHVLEHFVQGAFSSIKLLAD